MKKKILTLLVLLMVAATGAWADNFFLEVDGTSATLKYGDKGDNPHYIAGDAWYAGGGNGYFGDNSKASITSITVDASCQNQIETDLAYLFVSFTGLEALNGLENLNTAGVANMMAMFAGCEALTTLDLSGFNTADVIVMEGMFYGCSNLANIYVGAGWNVENVTNSENMFVGCSSLPGFKTSNTNDVDYAKLTTEGGYLSVKPEPEPEPIDLTFDATAGAWTLAAMPAYDLELEVDYEPGFDLTLAEGSEAHGKVAFTIGDETVTEAYDDEVVTVTVAVEEGYLVTRITAEAYTTWDATRRSAPDNIPFYGDIELTPVPGVDNAWTFTMPPTKVKVTVQYAQIYNVDVRAGRFATFYAAENIQLAPQTPEGVALHTITSVNETEAVVGAPIEGIVAANTPLLIFNGTEEYTTVTIIPTLEQPAGSVMWADEFRGTATDSTFTAEAMETADYYLLSGGKNFAMVYGAGTLSANQCWLQFDKQASAGVRQIKIVFGEETGISLTPSPSPKREGSIYSLDGRRVVKPTKGVYIMDGQKVVIK